MIITDKGEWVVIAIGMFAGAIIGLAADMAIAALKKRRDEAAKPKIDPETVTRIILAAHNLEAFFAHHCGPTADWPVRLVVDEGNAKREMIYRFTELRNSLQGLREKAFHQHALDGQETKE